ncbi:MAG TPA: hypothetical protein PLY94_02085 [Gemmatimonadaceae bacterium]|jgi:hypothetical protein|nr:hypothetical protein [Gemmatimonadaceae bacterium]
MTIWYVNLMWALMLLGVALFTGCCLVFNPVLKSVRVMGIATAYAIGAWMALTLPWRVALATWCLFAAFGGAVALAYELWARWRYRGSGRKPRPLVLLQGFILWPTMVPEAVEGVLIDAGVLEPSWTSSELHQQG